MHTSYTRGPSDPDVIWWISEDRRISGSINGREYARIVNGIPYRIDN